MKTCKTCNWFSEDAAIGNNRFFGTCTKMYKDVTINTECIDRYGTRRIVITGGPCGGKTTVINRLATSGKYIILPEVASQLLEGGYPPPNPWSQDWQDAFQRAIFERQREVEEETLFAEDTVNIQDRGIFDIAAYLENGMTSFKEMFDLNDYTIDCFIRDYHTVIHLESLATQDKLMYEKLMKSNPVRFEAVDRAQEIDRKIEEVWSIHPEYHKVSKISMDEVFEEVSKLINS
jgi:predicted ATPase